jgi:hypothetical protein
MKIQYLAMISLVAAAPAWALDLKSVELGQVATRTQLTESLGLNFGENHCRMHRDMPPDERKGTYRCDGGTLLEGEHVYVQVTFGAADTVEQIDVSFLSGYFDQLAAAATRKWGKPKSMTRATLQNGFGAQFAEVIEVWMPDGGIVSLYQLDPTNVSSYGLLQIKAQGEPPQADPTKSRM